MAINRSLPALKFDSVTKTFAHAGGRKLLRERVEEYVKRNTGGRFTALNNISFELQHGDSMGLIGHNGAGKSTLLNLATGLSQPDKGSITVDGRVAALLELGAGFHPDLTGIENLAINASLMGLSRKQTKERTDSIVEFSGIGDFIKDPLRTYSSGMVLRLAFSVMVHTDPDMLLMDEIIGVGDQDFFAKCLAKIQGFQTEGKTMLIASHSVSLLKMLCQRVIWLDHGNVVRMGPADEVIDAYQAGRPALDRVP